MLVEGLLIRCTNKSIKIAGNRFISRSSQLPKTAGKHYRLWSMPGDFVFRKEVLAKQHTMKWHPGLNAGIDDDRTIYSLCDGILIITEEKFDPDWTHPLVNHIYKKDELDLAPSYKRYLHVIPKRRISEFKLIDLV